MTANPGLRRIRVKILILSGICLLFVCALICRFYHVQIVRHNELLEKAQLSYTASSEQKRQRGKILDFQGEVFAGNLPKVSVSCAPYSLVEEPYVHLEKSLKKGVRKKIPALREARRRKIAVILAKVFGGKNEDEYYRELAPWEVRNGNRVKRNYLVIDKAADPHSVQRFKEEMKAAKLHLGGFVFEEIYVRCYPRGRMLANVIGFANVGRDGTVEHSGLEKTLGNKLQAVDTTRTFQRSGDGSVLPYGEVREDVAGHDGDDVYLTIREPLQAILEDELDKAWNEHDPKYIYAVIVDPSTGNILAMAQRPNFDLQDVTTAKENGLANALAGNAYEPGSVMKPFFIAKAMDEGIIGADTQIDCGKSNVWYYGGFPLRDPRGYGMMTPGGVLKKSSNIGTAKVSLMMGDEMVNQTLRDFRFGVPSGLPFLAESNGIMPRYPFRDKVTVTRVPIGYAEQVTALQLARAYSTIANRGMMPQLRLIDRYRKGDTGKVENCPYQPQIQVLKHRKTFDDLVDMLISVTAGDGTGKRAAIPGYEVAGKTGTSSMVINGIPSKEWYRASFCGFVPARHPQFVMVVTVEGLHVSSKKGYGGGAVAAPVFQSTMSRALRLFNVQPDFPDKLHQK